MNLRDTNAASLRCLSKRLISEVGAPAAELLSTLCLRQANASKIIAGKKRFFCPLGRRATGKKAISENYQPLQDQCLGKGKSRLYDLVQKLKGSYIEVESNLNQQQQIMCRGIVVRDKTLWYHVPDKTIRKGFHIETNEVNGRVTLSTRQQDRVYFSAQDVKEHGTIARAIVKNLIFREFHLIGKSKEGRITLTFIRNAIARETGLPLSTVSDAFRYFVLCKVLATVDKGKTHSLLVSNPCAMKGRGKGRVAVAKLAGIEGTLASNPCAKRTVLDPVPAYNRTGSLQETAKELAEKAAGMRKPKKVQKRRRGKKPVEKEEKREYTKHNEHYWKVKDSDGKPIEYDTGTFNRLPRWSTSPYDMNAKYGTKASNPFAKRTKLVDLELAS